MAAASLQVDRHEDLDLVDRWFRALDQRRIHTGLRERLLHVTSIFVDEGDVVWIQIADGLDGASIVLRVSSTTPLETAIRALISADTAAAHPLVVTATE